MRTLAVIGPSVQRLGGAAKGAAALFIGLAVAPHYDQREAFTAGLVDDCQDAELTAIMSATLDKVVGPDVSGILRPQPDSRAIVEP